MKYRSLTIAPLLVGCGAIAITSLDFTDKGLHGPQEDGFAIVLASMATSAASFEVQETIMGEAVQIYLPAQVHTVAETTATHL